MRRLFPLILLLTVAAACSDTPDYVIPKDKMASLMADIYIGEAVVESSPRQWVRDSTRTVLLQSIYARYGVTAEDVDSSMVWYGRNIQSYMEMLTLAEDKLKGRIDEAERQGGASDRVTAAVTVDGDSVDVWTGLRSRRNSPTTPSDYITFNLTPDRNWDRGDRYTLSVKGIGTRMPVSLRLGVEYGDGTVEAQFYKGPGEGVSSVRLVLDSAKTASTVYGSIKYHAAPDEVSYLDSISLVRTRMGDDNNALRRGQLSF